MAKMVSFVNFDNTSFNKDTKKIKEKVESKILILKTMVENKEYENNYSNVIKVINDLYYAMTEHESSLLSIIKKSFQGNYTRGIYTLILQDAVNLLSESISTMVNVNKIEFSKYLQLVEDKEDIKIEPNEYGTKLEAFNTKINLKFPNYSLFSKEDELGYIISTLGVVGTYQFFQALLKVVAVVR